jgi:muramidase (phage lysozyme)
VADPLELIAALEHPNVRAFLWMLRHGEGTQSDDGYRIVFGGRRFVGKDGIIGTVDDFADHPRGSITASLKGKPITSTAAGAYQFLSRTWDGLVRQYGFADFSPKNQDLGAVALIKGRKALDDVIAGRFEQSVMKCNKEWASLPGSPYGQPVVTMDRARQEYLEAGGTIAAAAEPQPAAMSLLSQFVAEDTILPPTLPPPVLEKETPVSPFIAAALPHLIDVVPKLASLFASGSPTSQRNIKAAEIAVEAAKEAIGAHNEQELVETLKADPAAAAVVRAAVEAVWFKIDEVGGGIVAAREVDRKSAEGPGFWRQPGFWITLLLLPLVYGTVYAVLTGDFTSDVKAMVVSSIMSGLLAGICGFWLGTSFSSQRKTDLLAR